MSKMGQCNFTVRFMEIPLVSGVIGYKGNITLEQLREDNDALNIVLDGLFRAVVEATKTPVELNGFDVVLYLPDLIE